MLAIFHLIFNYKISMMKYLLSLLLLMSFSAFAQPNADSLFIKRMANDILKNGKAYENLTYLTKKIGGRLAGSPQSIQAAHWGVEAMKLAGADAAYLQECMVPHWVRGGVDKATVVGVNKQKSKRSLDVLALGNSMGTKTPVQAEVLAVADFDDLEKRKDEVKGKIVYYNYGFDPTNLRPGTSYGQAGVYRRNGASRAAKYGAVGVLIRSLTEATDNNPHTGAMSYNDSFPKIPAAALGYQDADYLWNLCKQNTVTVEMHTHGYFLPDTIGYNVIGEIKGSAFPDQFITVGGHLDSWDVNEGAHDDGTGVVQTIEILRVFKTLGYQPKHTIRFVLFANEENGLRGGEKYAEVAKEKNEKHVFALESDAGGFTPRGFGFTCSPEQLQKIKSWLPLLQPYGIHELSAGGGGADIGPLQRNFKTPVAGLQPDGQRYFDHHHARNDVLEAVNKRELNFGAINMAALIYLVDKYGLN